MTSDPIKYLVSDIFITGIIFYISDSNSFIFKNFIFLCAFIKLLCFIQRSFINYVDKNNYIIFHYNPDDDRHRSLYVYYDIWSFFGTTMEYSDHDTKEIIKNWLNDIYGLIDKPIGITVSKVNIMDQN